MHKRDKPLKNEETTGAPAWPETMAGPRKLGLLGHSGPNGMFVKNTFLFHSQGLRMDFINIYSMHI